METILQHIQGVRRPDALQGDIFPFRGLPVRYDHPAVSTRNRRVGTGGADKGHAGGVLKAHHRRGKVQLYQVAFVINPERGTCFRGRLHVRGDVFILLGFGQDQGDGEHHQQGDGKQDFHNPEEILAYFLSVSHFLIQAAVSVPLESIIYGAEEHCQIVRNRPDRFVREARTAGFQAPDSLFIKKGNCACKGRKPRHGAG